MKCANNSDYERKLFRRRLGDVVYQVVNYLEGFHLAMTDEPVTTLLSNHSRVSFDNVDKVFKELDLKSLGYDPRGYYEVSWFNLNEVYRIVDEVRPLITNLSRKFRLRTHQPKPDALEPLFENLFTLIRIREEDKLRFKASLSTLMTQCIRDILEIESNRARFALVLWGQQGCGKTTFNSTLCKIMTGKDIHLQKRVLYSGFDSQELLNPVFRVEDLDYQFRDVIDVLKTYITNVTETTINVKYKPEQRVVIRTTPLMDTNRDFINIIKTDGEQRRFCIFELRLPERRVKSFERRLEKCLKAIFECHTTQYYYDLDELMEENLRLTDTAEDMMDFFDRELYHLTRSELDTLVHRGYSKTEFKALLQNILTRFNPDDNFLSDGLIMKLENRFFNRAHDGHRKTYVYLLKHRQAEPAGEAGEAGNRKNPYIGQGGEKFFIEPAIPAKPALMENLLTEELFYSGTLEDYLNSYRDSYVRDVIIANNRVQFYDDDPVEPDDREEVDVRDLSEAGYPRIYYNKSAIENHYNIAYPTPILLESLDDFKLAVRYDNIGGKFLDDKAKNDNFLSTNTLLVDIDAHNGEELDNIDNVNKLGVEYFRVPSKSGKGYHLYFPLSHQVEDSTHFKVITACLYNSLEGVGVTPDRACKNPSRKFFGTSHTDKAIHHKGERFDVVSALGTVYRVTGTKQSPKSPSEPRSPHYEVSENNELTDLYFSGRTNPHQVVQDLPHIVGYLTALKKHDKEFYSESRKQYFKIDEVISEIKKVVRYDETHVQYIDYLLDKAG